MQQGAENARSIKMDEQAEQRLELKRQFSDFLDQDHGLGEYPDKIKALLTKENVTRNRLRLEVDVHDLRHFDAGLFSTLLTDPAECIQPFEEALDELVRSAYPKVLQVRIQHCRVFDIQYASVWRFQDFRLALKEFENFQTCFIWVCIMMCGIVMKSYIASCSMV